MSNSAVLQIKGMHCASCVSRVEKAIAGVPGVSSAAVNLASASAHIAFKGRSQSKEVAQAVENAGFTVTAPTLANPFQDDADSYKRAAIFAGFLALPVFVLEMGSHLIPGMHHWIAGTIGLGTSAWIQMILTALILIGPGRTFFTIGIRALMRRAPEMNALVALGSGAAFLFSTCVVLAPGLLPETARAIYFESAAIIVVFILIGRWLEARAKGQAGDAVRAMLALRPDSATVLHDGKEKTIAVVNLKIGDEILARPGERIATDGVILSGQSPVDEAMISGEPMPIDKAPGDTLIGGTMNGAGAITYRATAVGEDTYLAGMARLVDHAQSQKLPIQHVLDKVTRVFVPVVICVAVLACTVWLLAGASLSQALVVLVSVLIIACPCAMGLATPASIMVGTGRAAERGILFRRSEALQVLKDVSIFAFDKTGTLTKGEMTVSEVQGGDEVLRLAAAVEALSEHPIAQAIVAASAGMKVPTATGFVAEPGQGATAFVDGSEIRVGNAAFVGADAVTSPSTTVFVARDGDLIGSIALADSLKETSQDTVQVLQDAAIEVAMITGDAQPTAKAVARQLGIDKIYAGILPSQKAATVKDMQSNGKTAFIGDGINDAPALAQSDVGIALGTGTDIAIETADVVLSSGDPMGAARARAISQATMRNIRQNLAWAFGYNILLIPVAAGVLYPWFGVLLTPGLAAGAMALSSVAVVTNALRLRRAI